MRALLRGVVVIIVASAGTMHARVLTDQAAPGEPSRTCRSHEAADDAAARDLGPALAGARTVFLISEPALADEGRSLVELRHELQRWHRWEEVPRRNAADVTLTVSAINGEGGSTLQLGVRARRSDKVLWASSGRTAAAALKTLEDRLPSLEGACAPIQIL